jgi:hypothetical protein
VPQGGFPPSSPANFDQGLDPKHSSLGTEGDWGEIHGHYLPSKGRFSLALASWRAMMGGMRGIGGVFAGEMSLQGSDFALSIDQKSTHPHTASMEIHSACDERSSNYDRP